MEIREDHTAAQDPPQIASAIGAPPPSKDRVWLHVVLFIATLITTTTIWGLWSAQPAASMTDMLSWRVIASGLVFSCSLLTFLTVHEFGHYFAARYHKISASLPYYIPLPMIGIGTLGAVIRIKSAIPSRKKLFDIGASGPLAGFAVAVILLLVSMASLPPVENVLEYDGHQTLKDFVLEHGEYPQEMLPPDVEGSSTIVVGQTILFWAVSQLFDNVPPAFEMYHYPMLFAAWLALFFTALNMLPVGQLDGGHILYALVGPVWHKRIARAFVMLLLSSGTLGFATDQTGGMESLRGFFGPYIWFVLTAFLFVYLRKIFHGNIAHIVPALLWLVLLAVIAPAIPSFAASFGYSGWLIWSALIVFLIKVEHPPVYIDHPLTGTRKILAVASFVMFILCFSIRPLAIV